MGIQIRRGSLRHVGLANQIQHSVVVFKAEWWFSGRTQRFQDVLKLRQHVLVSMSDPGDSLLDPEYTCPSKHWIDGELRPSTG
jgi:hypothetical protein